MARRDMEATDTSEMDIDLIFGWNESLYNNKMQIHYQSHFTRVKRMRVTSLL